MFKMATLVSVSKESGKSQVDKVREVDPNTLCERGRMMGQPHGGSGCDERGQVQITL